MPDTPQRILIVRNDKLGDFVLSLPAFALARAAFPEARITALVPEYTRELAESCADIDEVLVDRHRESRWSHVQRLCRSLREHDFDIAITLFSTTRIALALWLARIPYRLAPATKAAQIFYNHRLRQRRSRSEKPEWQYNCELVQHCLADFGSEATPLPEPPYLRFPEEDIQKLRDGFCAAHTIHPRSRLIFLHAGSGGSANNLSLEQYATLASAIFTRIPAVHFVLTAGPGEEEVVHALASLLTGIPHTVYHSTEGLVNFARHLAMADLFIAGSTGPLHIAGALDVPTAAFYTRRRSATALRWQTLNSEGRRLAFSPPEDADETDMNSIDVEAAAVALCRTFFPE